MKRTERESLNAKRPIVLPDFNQIWKHSTHVNTILQYTNRQKSAVLIPVDRRTRRRRNKHTYIHTYIHTYVHTEVGHEDGSRRLSQYATAFNTIGYSFQAVGRAP